MIFKRCFLCDKFLWTKYDEVILKGFNEAGNPEEYTKYICTVHGDGIEPPPEEEEHEPF